MRALVADINRRGGLACRKLELFVHDYGGSDQTAYQAACTYFTQDKPVLIVFTSGSASGSAASMVQCLAKADVAISSDNLSPSDAVMRRLGLVYSPDDIAAERYVALLGHSLVDGGFFRTSPKPVVGLIQSSIPEAAQLTQRILVPILAQAGLKIEHTETYDPNDSTNATTTSSAVFRMQANHVTHIITYEQPLFYMSAAQSQNYHPAWSVSSRSGPGAFLQTAAPRGQLANSMGPGWQPISDVDGAHQPTPTNPAATRCAKILSAAQVYPKEQTSLFTAQSLCGLVFHFERVLRGAREVSSAGFRASAESLSAGDSPLTFSTDYVGGRHDGAGQYRLVVYNTSCSCYQYSGPRRAAPAS